MRKCFLILVLFFFFAMPIQAKVITGGVEVSVSNARREVFSASIPSFDLQVFKSNLFDKNNQENMVTLLNGKTELKDRILALFSDGSYGVSYKNNPEKIFYYSTDGILTHYEIKSSLDFPYKTFKYSSLGELVNTSLRVSEEESFVFSSSGVLIAHWFGRFCYDEKNNIIMTREILK